MPLGTVLFFKSILLNITPLFVTIKKVEQKCSTLFLVFKGRLVSSRIRLYQNSYCPAFPAPLEVANCPAFPAPLDEANCPAFPAPFGEANLSFFFLSFDFVDPITLTF